MRRNKVIISDLLWFFNTCFKYTEHLQTFHRSVNKFSSDEFQLRMFPYSYSWVDKNTLEFEVDGKNSKYLIQFDVAKKELDFFIKVYLI